MNKITNKITNKKIEKLEIKKSNYKYWIGQGLYILVAAKGPKYWRATVHFKTKEYTIPIGTFPQVDVAEAMRIHELIRFYVDRSINPKPIFKKQTLKKNLEIPELMEIAIKVSDKFDPDTVHRFPEEHIHRLASSLGIKRKLTKRELEMIVYLVINWME
jgi:hypothetical protein